MSAIDEIATERRRQIEEEGWTADHDDEHTNRQLAYAAACYAGPVYRNVADKKANRPPIGWPFNDDWWKPKDARRDLVRAAALILAEIERIDRAAARKEARR